MKRNCLGGRGGCFSGSACWGDSAAVAPCPPSLPLCSVYCWLHVSSCVFSSHSTITPYGLFPLVINQVACWAFWFLRDCVSSWSCQNMQNSSVILLTFAPTANKASDSSSKSRWLQDTARLLPKCCLIFRSLVGLVWGGPGHISLFLLWFHFYLVMIVILM